MLTYAEARHIYNEACKLDTEVSDVIACSLSEPETNRRLRRLYEAQISLLRQAAFFAVQGSSAQGCKVDYDSVKAERDQAQNDLDSAKEEIARLEARCSLLSFDEANAKSQRQYMFEQMDKLEDEYDALLVYKTLYEARMAAAELSQKSRAASRSVRRIEADIMRARQREASKVEAQGE